MHQEPPKARLHADMARLHADVARLHADVARMQKRDCTLLQDCSLQKPTRDAQVGDAQ